MSEFVQIFQKPGTIKGRDFFENLMSQLRVGLDRFISRTTISDKVTSQRNIVGNTVARMKRTGWSTKGKKKVAFELNGDSRWVFRVDL